ncbi:MAG: hypothetical protein QOF72_1394 [Blastocatellia bacterium]|jgi:plasmid stabilization system protein ParE|nr:hypothetical protein [Blastocatellia bacterium]
MNLKFSIVAEREIEAAADYYENEKAGLGFQFVEELNHAIAFVLQFPMLGRRFRSDLAVVLCDGFLTTSFIRRNKTP